MDRERWGLVEQDLIGDHSTEWGGPVNLRMCVCVNRGALRQA